MVDTLAKVGALLWYIRYRLKSPLRSDAPPTAFHGICRTTLNTPASINISIILKTIIKQIVDVALTLMKMVSVSDVLTNLYLLELDVGDYTPVEVLCGIRF